MKFCDLFISTPSRQFTNTVLWLSYLKKRKENGLKTLCDIWCVTLSIQIVLIGQIRCNMVQILFEMSVKENVTGCVSESATILEYP